MDVLDSNNGSSDDINNGSDSSNGIDMYICTS